MPVNSVTSEPSVAATSAIGGDGAADAAEAFANQIAKAAIAIDADPDGEILHEDQNRNQQQQHAA